MNTMKRIWAVCLLGSLTVAGAPAATFTTPVTINEGDARCVASLRENPVEAAGGGRGCGVGDLDGRAGAGEVDFQDRPRADECVGQLDAIGFREAVASVVNPRRLPVAEKRTNLLSGRTRLVEKERMRTRRTHSTARECGKTVLSPSPRYRLKLPCRQYRAMFERLPSSGPLASF